MGFSQKLRMFIVEEPIICVSLTIAGIGLFLPAVVRPILDSFEKTEKLPQPELTDVVAGMTGKRQN